MKKSDLPASIRRFVEDQQTRPASEIGKVRRSELRSPFSSYWYRAVACAMLSGRVHPKRYTDDSPPNMTDVNRFGKEANFNPYLFERIALALVAAEIVVERRPEGPYQEGPNLVAFWEHDEEKLPGIGRAAVLNDIKNHAGYLPKRATPLAKAHLFEFLTLFLASFRGRAIPESRVTAALRGLCRLPQDDLIRLADDLDIPADAVKPDAWAFWADLKDGKVLSEAMALNDWMNGEESDRVLWVFPGQVGLWMLGLDRPLPPYKLPDTLKIKPKNTIQAGMGLGHETLVPLFRHCKVNKIGETCEVQLDPKRMAQEPAGASPGEELRRALKDLEPFPPAIAELLSTEPLVGGEVVVVGCSALVKPENPQVLEAIRRHPNLKNYIAPGGPPGYLLIKPASEPYNFIERCCNLGFQVTMQGAMPLDRRLTWLPKPGSR